MTAKTSHIDKSSGSEAVLNPEDEARKYIPDDKPCQEAQTDQDKKNNKMLVIGLSPEEEISRFKNEYEPDQELCDYHYFSSEI